MVLLPILNINAFQFPENIANFYANDFVSHLEDHHKAITRPHKHDFYLVVLFTKGSGTHEIDFNSYPIHAGSLFMLRPGQTHNWTLSEDIEGYFFFHNKEYYNLVFASKQIDQLPFYYSNQNSPFLTLTNEDLPSIEALFSDILFEYQNQEKLKNLRLHSLVDLLYVDISRIYLSTSDSETVVTGSYSQKLHKLESLIEQNYINEKHPSKYAEWMFMSSKHLNRIVKTLLGKTTSILIAERVVLEAKRMLIHSEKSIDQIAESLGYDDPSYFSRFFKKKCGETPKQFAKRYL